MSTGQDHESYTDDQDHESYAVTFAPHDCGLCDGPLVPGDDPGTWECQNCGLVAHQSGLLRPHHLTVTTVRDVRNDHHGAAPIPATLTVVGWPDPVIDVLGFAPHHPYSEIVWCPIVGPSSVLAWRRLAGMLLRRPEGFDFDVAELAQSLGLAGTGLNAPVCRTLRRLVHFRLARLDDTTYAVRGRIPPAPLSHLRRLPPRIVAVHNALVRAQRDGDRFVSAQGRGQ